MWVWWMGLACTPAPQGSGDSNADTTDSPADTVDTTDTSDSDVGDSDKPNDPEELRFDPPSGRADFPPQESDGPGPRRILLATSDDGVHYVRKQQLLTDQGNTPNMLVLPNGRILVYYTAYHLVNDLDHVAVAVSDDNGESWLHYQTDLAGFPENHPPIGDPDILQMEDGSFRMYITNGSDDQTIDIISNVSADGFHFEREGIALDNDDSHRKDSLTQKIGDTYYMYVLSEGGWMALATSDDGLTFTHHSVASREMTTEQGVRQYILSNWMPDPDAGQRIFAFCMQNQDIRSFTTTDGITLTPDTDVSLGAPLDEAESLWVKDAAAQQLADGSWLMAYVAEIPE